MPLKYKMLINGEFVDSETKETFNVINPGNSQTIAIVPKGTKEDVKKAIDSARKAFDSGVWSGATPGERAEKLLKLAYLIEKNIPTLARLESMNQGKTIKQAQDSDLPFAVDNLKFFAGAARMLEGKAAGEYMNTGTSILRREPLGVVGSIVPWNYPFMISIWKIAPALAAGNTVILKPASYTPITALELGKLAVKAGFPKGVLNVITGPGATVGEELVTSPKVDMVSLTGDTTTGKKLIQLSANTVKRLHLELGGKAPFIVFNDANMNAALEGAIVGGFVNGGQDCTAATRIYVHKDIYKTFVEKLTQKAKKIRIGNQLDRKTDLGPLVSESHRKRVEEYIKIGKQEGAKAALDLGRPKGKEFEKGSYLQPTILSDVKQDMRVCQEEIFGPVLAVLKFSTMDEAIEMANGVAYGLASSVWTKDVHKAFKVANNLKFGDVWVNDHLPLTSELPHHGYKQSGSGSDLSMYCFDEYTQVKHVYFDLTDKARKSWHYTVYGSK
ncbi:aminobutyraldehyde dehydrogenase [Candidatus Micrarchaeota archaeon]|nr:aminobutyraldehyde dehydrogenase [Candidatus Micrarchaeota archaeon]